MNGNARQPLRRIAVLGGGLTGLLAALAMSRASPGTEILVVDLPGDPAALGDLFPTILPAGVDALALAGLDERDLIAAQAATHRLALSFADWPKRGESWSAGFGASGTSLTAAAFHQDWLEAQRGGDATPFDRFSASTMLAEAGHFSHPGATAGASTLPFDYGLRLEREPACRLLLAHLARRRIPHVAGTCVGIVRRGDGGIEAVRLDGDRHVAADLYLDCTGPASPFGGPVEEWGAMLPCDRLLVAHAVQPQPALIDRHQATDHGWEAQLPLRSVTLLAAAFNSATTSEGKARRAFGHGSEAVRIDLAPGRRVSPWSANVIALGDAAAAPLPLGWPGLTLALADLTLLVELLPGRDILDGERAEYNRRATARADHLRDWQALLLLRSGQRQGDFWAQAAGREIPSTLEQLLAQFRRRGMLVRHDESVIDREIWLATLLGLGLMPERRDAIAMTGDPAALAAALTQLRAAIAGTARQMPPYPDYLARLEAAGR